MISFKTSKVLCYGDWTVIQKRGPEAGGTVDFHRSWQDYKKGFGKLEENEFWLGNQIIHEITNRAGIDFKIYIRANKFGGNAGSSSYTNFRVGPETDGYRLECAPTQSFGMIALYTGSRFTTYDRDLDTSGSNCAKDNGDLTGGFWYSYCGGFYPNGEYFDYPNPGVKRGIIWSKYGDVDQNMERMEMRITRM